MNLLKFVSDLKYRSAKKTDVGILRVAFMVAALDGEVTDEEYETFRKMALECRGADEKTADEAMAGAMRSAGYLMLLSKRVSEQSLVDAFIDEAEDALPSGFAAMPIDDIRRAVVTWIAMGMSDGEYSGRERVCIEALRRHFAELKVMRQQQNSACMAGPNSVLGQVMDTSCAVGEALSKDFVARVEQLVWRMGSDDAAAKELEELIAKGN